MNNLVSIVILNWNGNEYLKRFLPSLVSYSDTFEIIVADNCSSDDSVEFLKINYPSIKIIQNKENGGFAKGYNDALKKVNSKYYILLNSDIEVTANWIKPMLNYMEKNEKIAGIQPKILSYNEKNKFEHAGASGGYLDKNYYPFCRGRIFEVTEEDNSQYNELEKIFWATGACLMIRSKVYHEAGGFDEDFFAHMEEIDLCWRIQNMGYEFVCQPASKVYHVGGGTLSYKNPKKTYLNFRNSLYMITKNNSKYTIFMIFKRLILDGLAGIYCLISGNIKHFFAILKAHLHYYQNMSKFLSKRKELKSKFKLKSRCNLVGLKNTNIIFEKYIKRKKCFSEIVKKNNFNM